MTTPTNPAPESAGEHEHCKHFNDWPMHAPDGIPSGDPGDGLGVQGECCGCDAVQPMPEGEQPHCPCYYATERSPDLWGDPGYCCGCGAALSASNPAPESAGGCRFCPHPITDHDPLSGACAVDGCGCGVTFGSAEKMRERFRRDFGPRIARESAGEEDLLPCPFCGSDEASVVSGMGEHWVLCANVECYGSTRMASTEAEAIAAWNRRPTPAAPQPETEGMTEAERIEIANLTAEINLAIYNTIPNVTLAQVERVNVRAILTAAKKGGRSSRQRSVSEWCARAFGAEHAASIEQRAVRMLEEAIEAYQAAGARADMAHRLVDHVFARPAGELSQELGGVGVTVLALAHAAGIDADDAERTEIARVMAKPLEHFAARNKAKNDAGFDVTAKKGGRS